MKSLFGKIVEAYKENCALAICGMAMMNGSTSLYAIYRVMADERNK
jgi:hypothetical protein